jgi:hypothetical protein
MAEVYEYMAKGAGSGMGREILVERGLAEWFFSFAGAPPLDMVGWNCIPSRISAQESAEEMVVLFANMLQGGDCRSPVFGKNVF